MLSRKRAWLVMAVWFAWQVVTPCGVQATDYVWDGGGGNQNWTTPNNWNLNSSYPQYSTDTATINTGATVHLDDNLDLGNLTVAAGNTLTFDHLKDLNLYSATVSNNGYIRLEQTGDYTKLKANGAVNLSGSGYLILGADTGNQLDHATGGYFINQSGHTIQGGGTIASPITNYGTIMATANVEMRVLGGNDLTNYGSGILKAEGYNSRLTLRPTISGGIIQAGANAYVYLDSATFINNPAFSGAGTIAVLNSTSMEGNFTNNSYININDNETLYLKSNPTVYNNGTIKVNSSGSVTELQTHNASGANTVTLSGTGSVELSGNANSKLAQYNSNDVFINDTNHTIKGGGTIAAPITNKGTIQADSGGAALQVADTFTDSGGTIKTVGSGVFDNAGSTTNIDSRFVMAGGTLRSTALRTYSSSLFSGYGAIERPLTINGGGSLTASGGTLSFASGASLANNGTVNIDGVNGALDNLATNPMTLSDSSGESVSMAGGTLKSTSGYTYYSKTLGGYGSITAPLGNTGTVTAQNGTLELHATVTGGTVNTGSGGTLALHGATLSGAALQGGAVTVTDDSAVNNGSASFVSGANLTINSAKTLTFGGSATLNNLGAINLSGALDNNTGAAMTLSTVTGGSVSLTGGELKSTADKTFSSQTLGGYGTINARFTNTGSLIADGGTLALANANFTNNGDLTVNNGAIFNNVSGANVGLGSGSTVLAGGELKSTSGSFTNTNTITGYGTVSTLLTNSGAIYAGNVANPLSLTGNITNSSGAIYAASASSPGILDLSSTISGGTINPKNGAHTGTVHLAGATLAGVNLGAGVFQVTGPSTINGATLDADTRVEVGNSQLLNLTSSLSGGQFSPGNGTVYLNNATLSSTSLGTGAVRVLISSSMAGSNSSAAALAIQSGASLTLDQTPILTNTGTITVGSGVAIPASLTNADPGDAYLNGGGQVILGGNLQDTLSSTGGKIVSDNRISGGGTIAASFTNNGGITASNGTLRLTGVITGSGNLAVLDDATLEMQQNVQARDFAMKEQALWRVFASNSLNLTGNFSFAQQEETRWEYGGQPGVGPNFLISGGGASSLEIGGRNWGATSQGFDGNFHLTGLSLDGADTYLNLTDIQDNGHRSSPEALYVENLNVPGGTTLNLNNLWLYTYNPENQEIMAVPNGTHLFGDGLIIGSPVPLPSTLLLLGSSLLGLAGWRRFRKG